MKAPGNLRRWGAWEEVHAWLLHQGVTPRYYGALLKPGMQVGCRMRGYGDGKTLIWTLLPEPFTVVGIGYRTEALGRATPLESPPRSCATCHGTGEVCRIVTPELTPGALPLFALPSQPVRAQTERCEQCGGTGRAA